MMNKNNSDYSSHKVFNQLSEYSSFYKSLSYSTSNFFPIGISSHTNIDYYIFNSIKETIESIHELLINFRISDAYALLRRYHDATILNLFTNIKLNERSIFTKGVDFILENGFIVEEIENWVKGTKKIPSYKEMIAYIEESEESLEISTIINAGVDFKKRDIYKMRERCNEHMHYNYFNNILHNNQYQLLPNKLNILDTFSDDIKDIFIIHLSYLFYINPNYMMSSDYLENIDSGIPNDNDEEYIVAPFIQEIFSTLITPYRPAVTELIRRKTKMFLE